MRLFYTPTSPFVRKVLVAAHELGLRDRIETTFLRPLPVKSDAVLSAHNPLNKIPTLVTDDGTSLIDSPVIVEYLETLALLPRLVPSSGPTRFRVLAAQALCDGILDAGILIFYERTQRPKELHWPAWIEGQTEKAQQGLDAVEQMAADWDDGVDLARICAAVTVGWLEFREVFGDIRGSRPRLAAWYERFCRRPSMLATLPHA